MNPRLHAGVFPLYVAACTLCVMSLRAEVRAQVLAAARRDPSPARSVARRRHTLWLAGAVAVSLAVFLFFGGLRVTGRPTTLVEAWSLGALFIAALGGFLALSRGDSMLGRSPRWLTVALVLTPLALLAWKVGVSESFPGMTREWPDRVGFRCLRLFLLTTALPLAAMLVTRRRSAPAHPVLNGAAIGVAVGAGSWFLVDLWCPVAYVPHLLLGHVFPLLLATVAGAVGGALVIGSVRR